MSRDAASEVRAQLPLHEAGHRAVYRFGASQEGLEVALQRPEQQVLTRFAGLISGGD